MINISNIETFNWEAAIRGMRNPMNSWGKSDSYSSFIDNNKYIVGKNDLTLMKRLVKSGTEHRKFLRQIFISMDIVAPLYWWKEFDTYKVGTVANSCSTMHKIAAKEFTVNDFSYEHLFSPGALGALGRIIFELNDNREKYINTKNKDYWWQMIQLLPSSYNQKRTVSMNYENALSIIKQRSNHKLDEWREFVGILRNNLPYMEVLLYSDLIEETK